MAIVKRDEGKKVNSNINVTPMVDVMLVLLIIFMVITPMLANKVNVTLAQTENAVAMADASKEDAIISRHYPRQQGFPRPGSEPALPIWGPRCRNCSRTRPTRWFTSAPTRAPNMAR